MGIGVFDRLVRMGVPTTAFIASARAPDPSRFLNLRARTRMVRALRAALGSHLASTSHHPRASESR
jgi:hypothetical protein